MRTVILRGCDVAARILRFHTDVRSAKVAELRRDPRAAMHFYDPQAKIQVRAAGMATLHSADETADAAWAGSRIFSRQCYGVEPPPGAPLKTSREFSLPELTEAETSPGRANFVAILVEVASFEWLYLASEGHRRAHFAWRGDALSATWLSP
jgi:pyridoxamine 5'-phosphate oxidase